jgi:hypothetical protein
MWWSGKVTNFMVLLLYLLLIEPKTKATNKTKTNKQNPIFLSTDVSTPKARTRASAEATTASTTNRPSVVNKIIPRSAKKTRLDVHLTAHAEI